MKWGLVSHAINTGSGGLIKVLIQPVYGLRLRLIIVATVEIGE